MLGFVIAFIAGMGAGLMISGLIAVLEDHRA